MTDTIISCNQPPLWERYQRQLKEWEHDVTRRNCAFSLGSQEKVPRPEKPPVFAFCFRPRGLDVPNKGSKQRSHRKFPVSGHHHASSADPDSLVFGSSQFFPTRIGVIFSAHSFLLFDSTPILFFLCECIYIFYYGREKIKWTCFWRGESVLCKQYA